MGRGGNAWARAGGGLRVCPRSQEEGQAQEEDTWETDKAVHRWDLCVG